jgi:hypothetical protein
MNWMALLEHTSIPRPSGTLLAKALTVTLRGKGLAWG